MSKSALNMYTKILSNRLKEEKKVISIHPGWVKTTIAGPEMNGRLTTDESAQRIMNFINNSDYENVLFWDAETNEPLPW
jgi:NAD(P)-dependent dehydrogenase (short-subunit alcohol dehydrogenase family)